MKIVKEAWITAHGGAAGAQQVCGSISSTLLSSSRLCLPVAHLCFLPPRVSAAPYTAAGSPFLAPSDRPGHNCVFRATSLALSSLFLVLDGHCEMCCLPSTPKGTSYIGSSHPSFWLESSKIKLFVYECGGERGFTAIVRDKVFMKSIETFSGF